MPTERLPNVRNPVSQCGPTPSEVRRVVVRVVSVLMRQGAQMVKTLQELMMAQAEKLSATMAREMRDAGLSEVTAPNRSAFVSVGVRDGRPPALIFTWESNDHTGPVVGNAKASEEFLLHFQELRATVADRVMTLQVGAQLAADLSRRMAAVGLHELQASQRAGITRVVLAPGRGLLFTWRSNGHTTPLVGNLGGCEQLIKHFPALQAQVAARERAMRGALTLSQAPAPTGRRWGRGGVG